MAWRTQASITLTVGMAWSRLSFRMGPHRGTLWQHRWKKMGIGGPWWSERTGIGRSLRQHGAGAVPSPYHNWKPANRQRAGDTDCLATGRSFGCSSCLKCFGDYDDLSSSSACLGSSDDLSSSLSAKHSCCAVTKSPVRPDAMSSEWAPPSSW